MRRGRAFSSFGTRSLSTPSFKAGFDVLAVELAAEREAAPIAPRADLGVDRLQVRRVAQAERRLDRQRVAVDVDRQALLHRARQVSQQCDAGVVLGHVDRWNQRRRLRFELARAVAGRNICLRAHGVNSFSLQIDSMRVLDFDAARP